MTEHLEQGTVIEKYTIEGVLGQGGMAIVYKVRHNQLGTLHALKVLTLSSPSIRRRLLLEGQVQARLTHSNIVSVTDVLDLDGSVGLIMEFVEGTDLETLLASRTLSVQQCDQLAEGIFRGIEMAHKAGLVHRDLKPANVLLKAEGHRVVPKVADFGLVKDSAEMSSTRSGVAMGTPRYMSPEQIRDAKTVDQRSDIFSLGCLYYAMVTGKDAFSPDNDDIVAVFMAIYAGEFRPVRQARPEVPERIALAIEKALQIDPADRHASVGEFRADWFEEPSQEGLWDLAEVTGSFELTESLAPRDPTQTNETFALTPAGADRAPPPVQESSQPSSGVLSAPAPRRRYAWIAAAALLAGLGGLVGLGGLAGATMAATQHAPAPAHAAAPSPAPAAAASPTPAPPQEPQAAPATEPSPAPQPTKEPQAAPAPVAPDASPRPRPKPAARPSPSPAPAPLPAPTPDVQPTPQAQAAPTSAQFRISGARGYLRGRQGDLVPGDVPPGTYAVIAFFDELSVTAAKSVSVAAGQEVVVTCKPAFTLCDVVVR